MFPGPIPNVRIKVRLAAFVGNDETKADFNAGRNTLPAQKFTIGSKQYLMDTTRQMNYDLFDKIIRFLAVDRLAFTKFAD